MDRINQLTRSALNDIDDCNEAENLESVRIKYFGKNGIVTLELKSLSSLSSDEKKKSWSKFKFTKKEFF